MNRSVGVTVSAVVVIFGSVLTLLAGMMMLFASSGGIPVPENQESRCWFSARCCFYYAFRGF